MSIYDGFYYYWDKYVVSPYCSTYDSTMFRFWLNCHQIETAGENLRSADQSTKLYMKARIVGREDIRNGGHARFIVRETPLKGNSPAGSIE